MRCSDALRALLVLTVFMTPFTVAQEEIGDSPWQSELTSHVMEFDADFVGFTGIF